MIEAELNFVFGQAQLGGRVAAIYLHRLRDQLYVCRSDENNNNLFEQRVIKEAVHELGHTFGLDIVKLAELLKRTLHSLSFTL